MADFQTEFSQIADGDVDDTASVFPVKDTAAASGSKGKWITLGQMLSSAVRLVAGVVPALEVTALTAAATETGTLSVGTGAEIEAIISGTDTVAIPTLAGGAGDVASLAVSGAAVGDFVTLAYVDAVPDELIITGRVTAPGVISVQAFNASGSSLTGANYEIRAVLIRFA